MCIYSLLTQYNIDSLVYQLNEANQHFIYPYVSEILVLLLQMIKNRLNLDLFYITVEVSPLTKTFFFFEPVKTVFLRFLYGDPTQKWYK